MNDREFAEFFAAHHQAAIAAARIEVEKGSDADTIALAHQIIDSQSIELATLQNAIAELPERASAPPLPNDPHMQAEVDRMMSLAASDLDRTFLIEMIAHHASALAPAHRARKHLERRDLIDLAESITVVQAKEIGEMRTMLVTMNAVDAGEDIGPATAERSDFGLVGDLRIPLTPANDAEFVDFFVPHHEAAIAMAEEEVARGSDADLVAMAESMRDTQTMEIATMRAAREAFTGSPSSPADPTDEHMQSEMPLMKSLSGNDLDLMFLLEMVPHHAAALPTAHRARPHVQDGRLRKLAQKFYDAQANEVAIMQQVLEDLSSSP